MAIGFFRCGLEEAVAGWRPGTPEGSCSQSASVGPGTWVGERRRVPAPVGAQSRSDRGGQEHPHLSRVPWARLLFLFAGGRGTHAD